LECEKAHLSLLLTTDQEIHSINLEWLGRDRPTDVLAFSQLEGESCPSDFMGDIVISVETAEKQADEIGHTLEDELDRLMVHGMLHLLGHDHVHGGRQAAKMKKKELGLTRLLSEQGEGN